MASKTRISLSLLVSSFCICFSLSAAQSPSSTSPSTSTTPATTTAASIYPGTSSWAYYGCYNETTLLNNTNGLRALNGGTSEAMDTMTVPLCLSFCASNSYSFAGLEYTRYATFSYLPLPQMHGGISISVPNIPPFGTTSSI